jgi:hypothetical protein
VKNTRKLSQATTHKTIENLSIAGATARMGPVALHVYAADFLSAARAAAPPGVPFAPARTYLVCRALELALKAFLSLKGCSLEQMAGGPFGHNLESLLAEADQHGLSALVHLEKLHAAEIRRASTYYVEKVFEYPALDEAVLCYPKNPDVNLLLSAAEAVVAVLREPCLNAG